MMRAGLGLVAGLFLLTLPAGAQDTGGGVTPPPELFPPQATAQVPRAPSGILVLNQERLVSRTLYGERVQVELEAATMALAAENRRIEAALTDEELSLTDLRATLPPEEFRPLAEEFDTRVNAIRAAQDAKGRDLAARAEAAQQRFFDLSFPILLELVRDRGAAVMLDSRSVLLSAETVDITEAAIARIDAEIGNGGTAPLLEPEGNGTPLMAPAPRPDVPAP